MEKLKPKTSLNKRALFLDRDGVINEDTAYPHKPEHITFRKGIFKFCKTALKKGYIIVVVSNQAGVAKGYYSEDDVIALHKWMNSKFREQGIEIAGFYYCPYHIDGTVPEYKKYSANRKPKPGMFLQASKDLGIDIKNSIMVGDKLTDRIELEDLKSIIIKSKYTGNNYDVESIKEAEKIL